MTTPLCTSCSAGPKGETGHPGLTFYVEGPYPGHHIFRCGECGERWIRHYGSPTERFGWTPYARQFTMRIPRADPKAKALV